MNEMPCACTLNPGHPHPSPPITHDVLLLLIPYSLPLNQFGDEGLQALFDGIKNYKELKELEYVAL